MYQKYRGLFLFICITIIVTILLYIILSVASNSIRKNKFAEEAKAIVSVAQNESINSEMSYFDSNSNKLKDYRGNFNYFFKLNEENAINYILIYNTDYAMELNSPELIDIETINSKNKQIYSISKNKLLEKVKEVHDDLSKKFIDYELQKENLRKYNEEVEKQKKENEKNTYNNTSKSNNTNSNSNNETNKTDITYLIDKEYYEEKSMTAGHKGEWINNRYVVTIFLGKRTHGGYSIEVVDVKAIGDDITIVIRTTSPSINSNTTQAINYPTIRVSFNKKPNTYKVVYEDGSVFEASQSAKTDNAKSAN